MGGSIRFVPVKDGEQRSIAGHTVTFFNTHSRKAEQFGFHMESPEGQRIVCTGDEPCQPACGHYLEGADWLLHEAFCLEAESNVFRPRLIGHGTVREAALLAGKHRVATSIVQELHPQLSVTVAAYEELTEKVGVDSTLAVFHRQVEKVRDNKTNSKQEKSK